MKQLITMHILPNISRNKTNHTIKFGHLIEDNMRNIEMFFFKSLTEIEVGRLIPDLFLLFKKALYEIKAVVSTLVSLYSGSPGLGHTKKANGIKFQTVEPEICSILIFQKRV